MVDQGKSNGKNGTLLWSMTAVVLTFPLCLLFDHFGMPGSGRVAWFSLGMLLIAIKVRWELSSRPWFWATVSMIAVLHMPLVFFVPWTSKWIPAAIMLPFCVVDCLVILGIIQLVERWMTPESSSQ